MRVADVCRSRPDGEALARGKWVHVGRVNSQRCLMRFAKLGAHSADGTFLAFRPDAYMPRVLRWLDVVNSQPAMELVPEHGSTHLHHA